MRGLGLALGAFFLFAKLGYSQLVINELSQGPSGTKEYVEFLVIGTPTCTNDCVDLRGWIFDDNNGTFASGSGTGIATGCYRFKNIAFWQCIKIGTLIVIYNDADKNASITLADDLSKTDGNCRLIIPANNNTLIESNQTSPSSGGSSSYSGLTYGTGGTWGSQLGMANSDDSFQVRDPLNLTAPYHSISWGNNVGANSIIEFAGTTSGLVMLMQNTVSNNSSLQSNWATAAANGTNQSPGAPNNAANASWINSLSGNCSTVSGTGITSVTISANPTGVYCDGQTITLQANVSPVTSSTITYQWFQDGAATGTNVSTLSVIASNTPTTFSVEATDVCSNTVVSSDLVIIATGSLSSVTINYTPVCAGQVTTLTTSISPANMTGLTFNWEKNGIGSGVNSTFITTVTSSSTSYTVNVTDACGTSAFDDIIISESSADASFIPTGGNFCKTPTTLVLTATNTGGTWNISPATSAFNATNGTVNLSSIAIGTYTISYLFSTPCVASNSHTFIIRETPSAAITPTGPINLCLGNETVLTANSAIAGNGIYSYTWSPVASSNQSITANTTGTYSVTVSNVCGSSISNNVVVNVTSSNNPTFSPLGGNYCVNTGGTLALTAANSSGTWGISPANAGFNTSTGEFNLPATSLGTYSVTYTLNSPCTDSFSRNFIFKEIPTANITPSGATTFCSGNSVNLTANTALPNNGIYSYNWLPGNATSSFITVTTSGTYTVSVSNACGSTTSAVTAVQVLPFNNADFSPNSTSFCETDAIVTFTPNTNGGAFSISPSTTAFNSGSKTLNPSLADKNVFYQITYAFGGLCPSSVTKTYSVNPSVVASITPSKPGPYCKGEEIILYSNSTTGNTWSTGATSDSIIVNSSNIYNLAVNTCNTTSTDEIVIELSTVDASFTPSITEGNVPLEVNFENNSSINAISYFWSFGDSTTSTEKKPVHTYSKKGEYLVLLSVKNAENCIDTASYRFIKVSEESFIYIPNTFTPNGDNLNDSFFVKSVGVDKLHCMIFNRWGKLVAEYNEVNGSWKGGEYPDGVYYYLINVTFSDSRKETFHGNVTLLH